MVGKQTEVAVIKYDAAGAVDVPILPYASGNDTLHFHIQYSPPASNLTTRKPGYQAHIHFFAADREGIELSMQNMINPKGPPASRDHATAISKAVSVANNLLQTVLKRAPSIGRPIISSTEKALPGPSSRVRVLLDKASTTTVVTAWLMRKRVIDGGTGPKVTVDDVWPGLGGETPTPGLYKCLDVDGPDDIGRSL
ncbi:hypothetical protein KVR01_003702 [Diaporthe batatas]|uniref:uncharacterized protein n=1 Tax=Diaporthe batatas TaxID=748121 RepID=UPI001D04F5A8|nr:uncharacterized protein KVR01_003702 [Diaporthe batatas]KAG8168013.1 hypothetical protein KVR01_003702 [Diaporthe batatas]